MAAGEEQNSWVMGELGRAALARVECFNNDGNASIAPVVLDGRLWWSYGDGRG